MDILHSYWRMEYIKAPKDEENWESFFATLPDSKNDREALIILREEYSYLLLNKFPYSPGHLLAVPYREAADLTQLEAMERNDLMETITKGKDLLQRAFNPDGFNIGFNLGSASGAGIPKHLHCHIVPRWSNDINFMPVIGQTRVLPQALDETWEHLQDFC
ncbi:MAG: AP-4-A phosphorylase [Candidatus Moanabacter tarae]|uniref:AP-4-A phosphorylase n=1 Tax=Candidatus Moanibacter tarae TaxID=2200854 RepID=A0A2Z4AP37_9BACT|nr:MAG: AP-4-A phosphorylase [Candidatus Moanabacter tarae]